jgi:hypothetical protein
MVPIDDRPDETPVLRIWHVNVVAAMLVGAAMSVSVAAQAATVDGVTFPDTVSAYGKTLHLNGIGIRTLTPLRIRAYAAGLYLEHPNSDARAIEASPGVKLVLIQYLHDATKEQVERAFRNGVNRTCGEACPAADAADFERLATAFPPVKVGDFSTYILTPNNVRATLNNNTLVDISNPDLARRVLDSFIGAHPPSEELRAGMLGQGSS